MTMKCIAAIQAWHIFYERFDENFVPVDNGDTGIRSEQKRKSIPCGRTLNSELNSNAKKVSNKRDTFAVWFTLLQHKNRPRLLKQASLVTFHETAWLVQVSL